MIVVNGTNAKKDHRDHLAKPSPDDLSGIDPAAF